MGIVRRLRGNMYLKMIRKEETYIVVNATLIGSKNIFVSVIYLLFLSAPRSLCHFCYCSHYSVLHHV